MFELDVVFQLNKNKKKKKNTNIMYNLRVKLLSIFTKY